MRGLSFVVAGCAGSALLVPVLQPQILIKKSRRNILDITSPELRDECERVVSQCGLNPRNVSLCVSNSFSSFSRGWRGNALVGVSSRYLLGSNPNHHLRLVLQGRQLDWDTEEGVKLKKILQPTLEELQFTVAHEIGHLKFFHQFAAPITVPLFILCAHKCSLLATSQLKSIWKQLLIRCGVYSTFAVAFLVTFVGIRRVLEYSADRYAASQGAQYGLGGITMMEKQMEMERIVAHMTSGQHQREAMPRLHPPFRKRIRRLQIIMEEMYPDMTESVD